MTTNEQVGAAVHQVMWRQRITQETVAKALGLNQATISKKVRGRAPFSIDELITISRVLGVKPSEILASIKGYACNANAVEDDVSRSKKRGTAKSVAA